MRSCLKNRVIAVIFSGVFALSCSLASFADTKGKMDPDDYLFLTIFRACGVSPGVDVGRWVGLYKGYLRSTGNEALLSQVEGYASLGWGDDAHGVDAVFKSVKGWLSLSDSYGTGSTGYSLPSSPSLQVQGFQVSPYLSISSQPFPEFSCDEPGYHYVFSQSYKEQASSSGYRENYYFPDGAEIIALADKDYRTTNGYFNGIGVVFYMVDNSSASGYSFAPCVITWAGYSADGSTLGKTFSRKSSQAGINPDICSLMNFPFYVFGSVEDMENYCKTGAVNNTFNNSSGFVSSLGEDGGLDPELQKNGVASIGDTMSLPASIADAEANVAGFQKPLDRDTLMSALGSNGLDVVYYAAYQVQHLRENISDDGGSTWETVSEETLYGIPGEAAAFQPLDLEGYSYVPALTEPGGIQEDESTVVKLYYELDEVPYAVEHYTENIPPSGGGVSWTLADTESFTGKPGAEASFSVMEYPGYSMDGSLTVPVGRKILSDGSLVVQVYYTLDDVPYTVEHYTENIPSSCGGVSWALADTESFTGKPGTEAGFGVKVYPGYSMDSGLIVPADRTIPGDGSLVIQVYYTLDSVPYTVEHYTEDFVSVGGGKSWTLADVETFTGKPGTEAEFSFKRFSGYAKDGSLTSPADRKILSDGSLVIRLYYKQSPFSVITEPVIGAASTALPYAAVIGSALSGGFYLLNLFKRVTNKA